MTNSTRMETDSLGAIAVPNDRCWGAQTQRALLHFSIGTEKMPPEIINAIAIIKKAAAMANCELGLLDETKTQFIVAATEEIITGKLDAHFPLHLWQSGSGTQTNMNVNEVIANRATTLAKLAQINIAPIHPNDDVNKAQSTNDVFPTAMHIAATKLIKHTLLPSLTALHEALQHKQKEFHNIVKIGRTHLQDAVSLTLGQEFSGYIAQLDICIDNVHHALRGIQKLALGGTAVGTGINAHPQFAALAIKYIAAHTDIDFTPIENKFAALAGHEAISITSSALKTLATTLFKIANDIRWLASGPRCGLGELILPTNEPGSSIMPGKINPTQCEMLMMVCAQVMGNDAVISFANSQGNFELNVFKPVIIYNLLQAIHLISDACNNFRKYAIQDLQANKNKINNFVANSLMHVTALTPHIGYTKAAQIAQRAFNDHTTLRDACLKLGYLSAKEFDALIKVAENCNTGENES